MTIERSRTVRTREQSADDLEKLYRNHPVREAAIMARLDRQHRNLDALRAMDLANDAATDVTDQNHIGGSRAVFALAAAVRLTRRDVVVDLGCGIGGSARLLAHRFGCRVDGIDISQQRVREARHLTALVGLSDRVRITRADMLRVRVPRRRYDVLWGQGAWNHIVDKPRFLRRWMPALKRGGRIAFEDVYLRREPSTSVERRLLASLERDWHATVISVSEWKRMLSHIGATVMVWRDLTSVLITTYDRLGRPTRRPRIRVPALERRAWRNATRAAESGLIGYVRIAATT